MVLRAVPRVLCAIVVVATLVQAQSKLATLPEQPPSQLAPAIASALQSSGVKATVGEATLDIWWAQAIAIGSDGPGWSTVESGTLVGAVRVTGPF